MYSLTGNNADQKLKTHLIGNIMSYTESPHLTKEQNESVAIASARLGNAKGILHKIEEIEHFSGCNGWYEENNILWANELTFENGESKILRVKFFENDSKIKAYSVTLVNTET